MCSCYCLQAPLTAGMLFEWHHLKVLDCLEHGIEAARNMVASCRLNNIHDLHKANVSYQLGDPLGADFVEADVVFVDATQLGFDEVALLHALLPKLEDLVAGSFIIVLTHVEDPFPNGCPFVRLDCGASYSAPEPACVEHVNKSLARRDSFSTSVEQSLPRATVTVRGLKSHLRSFLRDRRRTLRLVLCRYWTDTARYSARSWGRQ